MVFTTGSFFVFIAFVFVIIACVEGRARKYFVLIASYVFYAGANPDWLVIILIVTIVDFYLARLLARQENPTIRLAALIASCASNLGLLIWFKYADFFMANLGLGLGAIGAGFEWKIGSINIPIGISFFIFESLSYIVDVYRKKLRPCDKLSDYALFIAFFPHLVSGPIVRAADFLPQIAEMKPFRREMTISGMELIVVGYFKKTVVGDNIGMFVDQVFANGSHPGGAVAWLAAIGFAIQIYADFSGYTDIARGLAKIMGIELCQNFRWPYLSASPKDFWRRWHMSLSLWMRDYIYIALGGNRSGKVRLYFALFATWFLGGLWHGAAWHYVAWGLYHGFLVWGNNVASTIHDRWRSPNRSPQVTPGSWAISVRLVKVALTFAAVVFGWVLFRAADMDSAAEMWQSMLGIGPHPFLDGFGATILNTGVRGWNAEETVINHGMVILVYFLLLALHSLTYWLYKGNPDGTVLHSAPYFVRTGVLATIAMASILFQGDSRVFIYFSF